MFGKKMSWETKLTRKAEVRLSQQLCEVGGCYLHFIDEGTEVTKDQENVPLGCESVAELCPGPHCCACSPVSQERWTVVLSQGLFS